MPDEGRGRRAARRRIRSAGLALACVVVPVAAAQACGSSAPPPPPPTPIDAEGVATNVELATRIQGPVKILFDWRLNESGSRTGGRGVVRMEPPYKARLDLFTEQGETVLRAALVDDVLRLPPGVEHQDIVPVPTLLWASLGVFRPGNLAYLNGGEAGEGRQVSLSYSYGGGEAVRYVVEGTRIQEVELLRGGQAVERVAVDLGTEHTFPTETVYRNLADFRELTVTLDRYEEVDVYPPDIWLSQR